MRCFIALSVLLCVARFSLGAPAPQFPDMINFGGPAGFFPAGFGELIQQLSQVASSLNALGTRFGSTYPQQGFTNYAVVSPVAFASPVFPDDGLGLRQGVGRPGAVGAVASSSTGGSGSSFSSVSVSNSNGGRPVAVTVTQENNQRPFVQVSQFK